MIVHMNYQQYRTARRLVHSCCNYDGGCCLLLDDGEECVCPQSITYSLICKWFRAAVLPLDAGLCAALSPAPAIGQRRCRECRRTTLDKDIKRYWPDGMPAVRFSTQFAASRWWRE